MDMTLLTQFRRFSPLPEHERNAIERAATIRELDASRDLIRQDDEPLAVHVLLAGYAYRFTILPGGRRQITALLIPGDPCTLQACLSERYMNSVRTITACVVAEFPRRVVLDWIETRPLIARVLWSSLLAEQAILHEWLVCAGARTAMQRIAHLFCELQERLGAVGLAEANGFRFPLTQQELGEITGLSTVHVNRTLQAMRSEELIVLRGEQLTILDLTGLREIAEFDPRYLAQKA